MDEVTLVRDVRPVQYEVIWDGSKQRGRQLFVPEYPRQVGVPEPHKRLATEQRNRFNAWRLEPVTVAVKQPLPLGEES
jgi:hypothetical protein